MKFDKSAIGKFKKEANTTLRKSIQKIDELATVAGEKLDKDAEWRQLRAELEEKGFTPDDVRKMMNIQKTE